MLDKSAPPTRAVILAAGRGRRLRPYTDSLPKPLLPHKGQPILAYLFTALEAAGITEACLVVGYLASRIESYLRQNPPNLQIHIRHQEKQLGTAHALHVAQDLITEPILVTAADYLVSRDYLWELKAEYLRAGLPLAGSLKRIPGNEVADRSSVQLDDDGHILKILEKPDPANVKDPVGASLIFVLPPAIRQYLREPEDALLSPRGEYEIQDVINQMLADGYQMSGFLQPAPREWHPPGEQAHKQRPDLRRVEDC